MREITMKKIIIAVCFIAPLAILALLGLTYWMSHNKLVKLDVACDTQLAEIDNMLKRRADLLPNLVNTVKGYAKHEKEIFVAVAEARAKIGSAKTVKEKSFASSMMDSALSRLMVVVEKYPDLKANQNFIRLQDELTGTENRIAVARTRYNESVKAYNTAIRQFFKSIVANMQGYEKREFFEIENPKDKEVPKVDFNS
jgi:LemA protein